MSENSLPSYEAMMNPTLQALRELGVKTEVVTSEKIAIDHDWFLGI